MTGGTRSEERLGALLALLLLGLLAGAFVWERQTQRAEALERAETLTRDPPAEENLELLEALADELDAIAAGVGASAPCAPGTPLATPAAGPETDAPRQRPDPQPRTARETQP